MISHLVLSKANHDALHAVCKQILEKTNAGAVHVIDRNGVGVTHVNRGGYELDIDILSSLVAGNVATANALASLIGEAGFETQVHQGHQGAFLVTQIGNRLLLIVWFDQESSVGLVKLVVKNISESLCPTLDEIERMSTAKAGSLFNT
jgi:predicted regulator of Ras-like GTPase activity (Roadblock/LC7/MglB family)